MELFKNISAEVDRLSPLVLAFIGDTVYDLLTRGYVIAQGNAPVNKMHSRAKHIVNAAAQSQTYGIIEPFLTEEENAVLKRGRNAKSNTSAKNQSIVDYRRATGVEALFGWLYLKGEYDRIEELYKIGTEDMYEKGQQKN